jgi:hypothetical protein
MIANLVSQDAAEYRVYEKGFFPICPSSDNLRLMAA